VLCDHWVPALRRFAAPAGMTGAVRPPLYSNARQAMSRRQKPLGQSIKSMAM
jgi:hypothetical protein